MVAGFTRITVQFRASGLAATWLISCRSIYYIGQNNLVRPERSRLQTFTLYKRHRPDWDSLDSGLWAEMASFIRQNPKDSHDSESVRAVEYGSDPNLFRQA